MWEKYRCQSLAAEPELNEGEQKARVIALIGHLTPGASQEWLWSCQMPLALWKWDMIPTHTVTHTGLGTSEASSVT